MVLPNIVMTFNNVDIFWNILLHFGLELRNHKLACLYFSEYIFHGDSNYGNDIQ